MELAACCGVDLGGAGFGDAEVGADRAEVLAVEPAGDDVPLAVLKLTGGAAEVDADVGGRRGRGDVGEEGVGDVVDVDGPRGGPAVQPGSDAVGDGAVDGPADPGGGAAPGGVVGAGGVPEAEEGVGFGVGGVEPAARVPDAAAGDPQGEAPVLLEEGLELGHGRWVSPT